MNETPTWLRPKRWLAFFLTLLGVCSFLAIVPVSHESASLAAASLDDAQSNSSFIDYLREGAREVQVSGHWTSLLPPLLAVMIAAFFRTMVGALVSAFAVGSFLSYGLNPLATAVLGVTDFLIKPALSQFSVLIILFLLALVGMVHVMSRSGGLDGLVKLLERFAKGRRRAKLAIGISGLLIFFDDYSNTLVVGTTMQKLSDRWKISREKLAYLVDSTTAPVAGLALLSTWVAFEMYLLGDVAAQQGVTLSGYGMLVEMLPLRFYCIGTLIFVFMSSASGRDFGPMLNAERRAFHEGKVMDDTHQLLGMKSDEPIGEKAAPRWQNAFFPISILLFGIVVGILILGYNRLEDAGQPSSLTSFEGWQNAFGAAVYDPGEGSSAGVMPAMLIASLMAGLVAIALPLSQGVLKIREVLHLYGRAFSTMWMAIFILAMAWAMREICDNLGTADYLIAMLGGSLPLWILPLLTFLIAAVMSFATGTSWGTMGILIPIMMPLAAEMGALEPSSFIIYLLTAAAVLDGAIFGDHCSPISDTTVLSSISSGCDHIAHVNTQLYYALTTVILSCLFGYLSVAQGMPNWLFFVLYPLGVFGVLKVFGRRAADVVAISDKIEDSIATPLR
ncbi:Na+/H+ antiporter NhaC family protein [Pelagicoccus sp. SDUM812002]|uniref:Na+/H+ antiporter NhaC family protein n=1 Tax=Pelagicoccus sp. SDUM812002 TaxID=3041266 RepID=UPI00280FD1D0|nr:Na+/H+ antiporter NhaC family protein [Pelagicoccus sp. SDUM812002]MDQ8186331.1 Na+/H+ antiporter NhaC family protein [Pelagicoccus sp. SDUM812002]